MQDRVSINRQSDVPVADRVDIIDALYRFAAGQDLYDRPLFESAFTEDATVDFVQPALRLGAIIPTFHGRTAITDTIFRAVASLDTTHTITNPRILSANGQTARMAAMVEAQHLPRSDHARHLLLKNHLDIDLRREGVVWQMANMRFKNVWYTGDPSVLFQL